MQLVRMQQLNTTWLSLPPEEVPAPAEQKVPGFEQLHLFSDQVNDFARSVLHICLRYSEIRCSRVCLSWLQ